MQPTIIEGTWEEIERRKAELIGKYLRIEILPEETPRKARSRAKRAADKQPRRPSALGK